MKQFAIYFSLGNSWNANIYKMKCNTEHSHTCDSIYEWNMNGILWHAAGNLNQNWLSLWELTIDRRIHFIHAEQKPSHLWSLQPIATDIYLGVFFKCKCNTTLIDISLFMVKELLHFMYKDAHYQIKHSCMLVYYIISSLHY